MRVCSLPRRSRTTRARWPALGSAVHAGECEPALPRALAHLGIGHVVLEGGHLLGLGIARPHALRPAEVRDARLRGDARAGEDDDALGGVDELRAASSSPLGTPSYPLARLAPLGKHFHSAASLRSGPPIMYPLASPSAAARKSLGVVVEAFGEQREGGAREGPHVGLAVRPPRLDGAGALERDRSPRCRCVRRRRRSGCRWGRRRRSRRAPTSCRGAREWCAR